MAPYSLSARQLSGTKMKIFSAMFASWRGLKRHCKRIFLAKEGKNVILLEKNTILSGAPEILQVN